jgi:hypothetical protein
MDPLDDIGLVLLDAGRRERLRSQHDGPQFIRDARDRSSSRLPQHGAPPEPGADPLFPTRTE